MWRGHATEDDGALHACPQSVEGEGRRGEGEGALAVLLFSCFSFMFYFFFFALSAFFRYYFAHFSIQQ